MQLKLKPICLILAIFWNNWSTWYHAIFINFLEDLNFVSIYIVWKYHVDMTSLTCPIIRKTIKKGVFSEQKWQFLRIFRLISQLGVTYRSKNLVHIVWHTNVQHWLKYQSHIFLQTATEFLQVMVKNFDFLKYRPTLTSILGVKECR